MNGVINLLKPPGMTSHDAVAFVRRVTGVKRVGHTGTLDPAAAGVLPVCIGQATRLVEYLQAGRKQYIAEATFGFETDTLDAVGEVNRTAAADHITHSAIEKILPQFMGSIQQTPPMYSAIKQDGKKLYELARAGENWDEADIKVREVEIFNLRVTQFWPGETSRAMFNIECSGGTYIRSLVRDIARALDSAATMSFLVRSESGFFTINEAFTLEQIDTDIGSCLIPMTRALSWCASQVITDDEAILHLSQGRVVPHREWESCEPGAVREDATNPVVFQNKSQTLAALARLQANTYKPEKVFDLSSASA